MSLHFCYNFFIYIMVFRYIFCRGLDIRVAEVVTTKFDNISQYHNNLFHKNVSRCIDIVNTIKYTIDTGNSLGGEHNG